MRLINAEKLLEDIKRSCMTSKDVEALVKAQPTVFDLDKVLEDLEEYAYSEGLCFRNRVGLLEIVKGAMNPQKSSR